MTTRTSLPFMDFDMSKFNPASMMGGFKVPGLDFVEAMAVQRRNVEALAVAGQLALEGMQAITRRQIEIMRGTAEEAAQMMNQMLVAGTPEDKIARQADLLKAAFEKGLADIKEISEIAVRANGEAATVINRRVSESLDEVKTLARSGAGK